MKRFLPISVFGLLSSNFNDMISKLNQTNLNQRNLIPMFFSLFMLVSFFMQSNGQNIKDLDSFLKEAEVSEKIAFEALLDSEGTVLLIYNNILESDGESKIANVSLNSINELYKPHSEFDSVELIKIKLKIPSDVNNKLELAKLSHFKNLKYILLTVTFDLCPENKADIECQAAKIGEMFLATEGTNPDIIFQHVKLM